jgi:hypothetical protein
MPELLVSAQVLHRPDAIGVEDQRLGHLPARDVRDLALLAQLPDFAHRAGLHDPVRVLVEEREQARERFEAADALVPAVHAAGLQHVEIALAQSRAVEAIDDDCRALHLPRLWILRGIDARHARCRDSLARHRAYGRRQRSSR